LYVLISVRSHEYFRREGRNILLTVPIGLAQAALGVELEVPTLEGSEKLLIPPGTRSGSSFRLAGRGVASLNRGSKGDQIVTVDIEVPKNLSSEQKEALRHYAKAAGETVENIDNSLISRLKRAFGRR
jgi:molecular chaperone DnaJ